MSYPTPLLGETVLAQTGTMNGLIPIDWERLRPFLLNLMGALGIFIIAWIAAILLSGIGQNILKRTGVDTRLSELISGTAETPIQAGKLVGQIIFWLVLVLGLVGALDVLKLTGVSQPLTQLLNEVFAYAPKLLGGLILALIAWALATVTKLVVVRLATSLRMNQAVATVPRAEGNPCR